MSKKLAIDLGVGILHLKLAPGRIPLHRLLGFATRIGSKRQFLFVSKILGKHYPVRPRLMAWSYRALTTMLLQQGLIGHSLWVGMAETATGLGYGVFAAAYQQGVSNALFIQTTRYYLSACQYLEFKEAHSHATDLFLYYPDTPERTEHFLTAQTLVLIDDEISTGQTFLRLILAYRTVNPHLVKVFIVSLVNFASDADRKRLADQAGVEVIWLCFRHGDMNFAAIKPHDSSSRVNAVGNGNCKKSLLAWPGRLGLTEPIQFKPQVLDDLWRQFKNPPDLIGPVLVLGTGECNAPAYLLGRFLEQQGLNIKVQSTTRSPIRQGYDIKSVQQFEDNYDDHIANFIYNMEPTAYQTIIVCHETAPSNTLSALLAQWQALGAYNTVPKQSNHASVHFYRPG